MIRIYFCRSFHFYLCFQPDIQATCSDHNGISSAFHFPASGSSVPVAKSFIVKRYPDLSALSSFQKNLLKTFQFFLRPEYFRVFLPDIELRRFRPVHLSGIGKYKVCSHFIHLKVTIFKLCIGQSESKGELHSYFCCVIISISHIQCFLVL